MANIDLLSAVHKSTKRDYIKRVTEFPKAEAARLAKKFDFDYWDGDRKVGYGGYYYEGRWRQVGDRPAVRGARARGYYREQRKGKFEEILQSLIRQFPKSKEAEAAAGMLRVA